MYKYYRALFNSTVTFLRHPRPTNADVSLPDHKKNWRNEKHRRKLSHHSCSTTLNQPHQGAPQTVNPRPSHLWARGRTALRRPSIGRGFAWELSAYDPYFRTSYHIINTFEPLVGLLQAATLPKLQSLQISRRTSFRSFVAPAHLACQPCDILPPSPHPRQQAPGPEQAAVCLC
jgi:hypothetical protein